MLMLSPRPYKEQQMKAERMRMLDFITAPVLRRNMCDLRQKVMEAGLSLGH